MTLFRRMLLPRIAGVAALVATLSVAGFVAAQDAPSETPAAAEPPMRALEPDPKRVYAIVNGEEITEADLAVAAQDYERELGQIPEDVRIDELLNVIIDMRLLAKAAEGAGVDKKEDVARMLEHERQRTLRNEYLRDKAPAVVTEDAVKARFDKEIADFKPVDELHLHHILVKTEDEAKAVIVDLDKGGDFAAIAK